MPNIFFISDTHFGHANVLTFKRTDGTLLRPGFANAEEMDEHMVQQWNSVVSPQDKVYHLGDVAINKKHISTVARLNGKKRLVRGNHDIGDLALYTAHFEEVLGVRVFSEFGFVCSHIPLHPDSVSRWKLNVHGHLHSNLVMEPKRMNIDGTITQDIDKRYMNVSVEQIDYTPIPIEFIHQRVKEVKDAEL